MQEIVSDLCFCRLILGLVTIVLPPDIVKSKSCLNRCSMFFSFWACTVDVVSCMFYVS